MKLDYSSKNRNWRIVTAGGDRAIEPKSAQWSPVAIGIGIAIVALFIIIALLVSWHHNEAYAQKQADMGQVNTQPSPSVQTIVIPLELPKSSTS